MFGSRFPGVWTNILDFRCCGGRLRC